MNMKTLLIVALFGLPLSSYADSQLLGCSNARLVGEKSPKRIDVQVVRGNKSDRVAITGAITFQGSSTTYPPTAELTYGFSDSSGTKYSVAMNVCGQGDIWYQGHSLSWMECWGPEVSAFIKANGSNCSE